MQRVVAVPVNLLDGRLRVAIADPANVHGIDELRVAARLPVDLAVASRDDILAELERRSRQSEVMETQSALDEIEVVDESEDDLEVEDGVSDAPLVRLVNSSSCRPPPTEPATSISSRRRTRCSCDPRRRRARRGAADSEAHGERCHTRLKVLAKLDIAERRKPQDGRISSTLAPSGACSTSASPCCRPSRASRS